MHNNHAGVDAQLYQWSCSSLDTFTNTYTLPDLGYTDDRDVSADFVARFSDGLMVDVFPIPPMLNCSGTVSAVEYCYGSLLRPGSSRNTRYGTRYLAFTLLILEQDGLNFMITDLIDIHSTPTVQICSDRTFSFTTTTSRYCCDRFALDNVNQFHLPASKFAFGVVRGSSLVFHLRYPSSFASFQVEQYSFAMTDLGTPAVGDTIALSHADRRTDMALRFLEFVISK